MPRRQILVLEDQANDAALLQATLQRSGFAPAVVATGQDAVRQVETVKPDLMLVDSASATSENGWQVLGEIRSQFDIPIVFLMPYGDELALERAVERAKSTEPDGFVLKPYHERELVQTVESVLHEYGHARKRARAREHLLSFAKDSPDLVITADVEGNILYLNPAAREMFGVYEESELSELHLTDLHPTWANVILLGDGIETAILDGEWHGETALLSADRHEIPVSQVILPHTGQDGRCEFFSLVARDISDSKRTEQELRSSEQMYRRIVESANVGMCIIDPENEIRFANPAFAKVLGVTVEELVGCSFAAFADLDSLGSPPDPACQPTKGEHCVRLFRKGHIPVWATLATSPMYDSEERYVGILAIITNAEQPVAQ